MIELSPSIEHILNPVPLQAFLSRYYQQEQLVIGRGRPSHYDGLIAAEVLDQMICASASTSEDVLVVDDCRDIDYEDYTRSDGVIDSVRVQQLFDNGATIILRRIHDRLPSVARLCRSAEQQFGCAFQANLYFSPPNAQGLSTHHDTHDVFVLQIHGSKRWQTYQPVVPLPLPGQRYYWKTPPEGQQVSGFTLHPGDLFYCPRGIPHNARATQGASLHISLGARVGTWAELLLEVVADVALRDPAFRAGLPPGYVTSAIAPEVLAKTMQELLARLQRQARPHHVLELMAERLIIDRPALIPEQGRTLQAAAALTPDTRVGARPGLMYRMSMQRNKVTVTCSARRITFPRFAASSLQFALCTASFLPTNLPGPLTEAAKLVLVRRLMREGLVVALPG
jgi:ribosomal protein L16 Arg81 hydroxylase